MPNSNYHAPGECDSLVLDDMNFFSALSFYVRRLISFSYESEQLSNNDEIHIVTPKLVLLMTMQQHSEATNYILPNT